MIAKDALQYLVETAVKSAGPGHRFFKSPQEPPHVYHVIGPDGMLDRIVADPSPADHCPYDLPTIAALAARAHQAASGSVEIWYCREGVVLVLDRFTRRDRASLDLGVSTQLQRLSEWDKTRGEYQQIEFVLLLRTLFADSLPAHPTIRDDIRRVDIKKAQEASSTANRANVSMSRSMVAEASGADKLPEVLTFDVPAFDSAVETKVLVRVVFDLDPQTERFRLIPIPGDVEKAFAAAERSISSQLAQALLTAKATDVPVFYGEP